MDENGIEANDYIVKQGFSEQEIDNLHQGKLDYKEQEEQNAPVRI